MKTFFHSGKLGDVIFSLPTIKAMGGGILYLPEKTHQCDRLYSNLKDLLLQQPYIHEVREWIDPLPYEAFSPGITKEVSGIDVNLDRHFEHPARGRINMVQRYFDIFGIKGVDYRKPWLTVIEPPFYLQQYNLLNVTPRFRDNSRLDWTRVAANLQNKIDPLFFVGLPEEWHTFCRQYSPVNYFATGNILQLARMINYSKALYCNQSCALAIAQGLGKTYYLEVKPGKTNCLFYTKNENILR